MTIEEITELTNKLKEILVTFKEKFIELQKDFDSKCNELIKKLNES